MLNFINTDTENLFGSSGEIHYRFHTQIDLSQYPQVHDFYEIILVTSGILHLKLCGQRFLLQTGSLVLIRPGDIHTKSGHDSSHINLAFPTKTVDALFHYLCDEECKKLFSGLPYVSPAFLSQESLRELKDNMLFLNTIQASDWRRTRTILRSILFEIITRYFFSMLFTNPEHQNLPNWLADSLTVWQGAEHRQEGLDFFCTYSGHTKEHICRSFKRFLGQSPTSYLNQQRLNYAVNLLLHSNYTIIDIAYEAGFKSVSRFYRIFRDSYGISPKQFCAQQNTV